MRRRTFSLYLVIGLSLSSAAQADDKLAFFENKIRPLLTEKCYGCHSMDAAKKKKLKGDFYIDMREGMMRGGDSGPAVVPGKPEKSLLMQVIRHEIIDMQMPPKKSKLSDADIADVETWIKDGCVDPRTGAPPVKHERVIDFDAARQFWSFRPLSTESPPKLWRKSWGRNPIDQFVLHKLRKARIPAAPAASKEVLARRLYMSITGLAPSEAEVMAFVGDADKQSWEKLIDKLLASPHFGERWGRHWLDLARFAESNGYAFDQNRNGAFQYRDFVIKAFNSDMPYDQFIRLQLAGDLIDGGKHDYLGATGFIAAGPFTSQQTAKERERSRYEQLDDLIVTVGTSMLGLTVGCARCHDHKYDPITSKDYYRMITAFEKTGFESVPKDLNPEVFTAAKKKFDAAHKPLTEALTAHEAGDLKTLAAAWHKKWQTSEVDPALLAAQQKKWEARQTGLVKRGGIKQALLKISSAKGEGKSTIKTSADGISVVVDATPPVNTYTMSGRFDSTEQIGAIMLEVFADDKLPAKGPGRAGNGNFILTNFKVELNGKPLTLTEALADFSQKGSPVVNALNDNKKSGWGISGAFGKDHIAVFKLAKPVAAADKRAFTIILDQQFGSSHTIGRFRIKALTDFPTSIKDIGSPDSTPENIAKILFKDQRSNAEAAELRDYFMATGIRSPFTMSDWRHYATKETLDVAATNFDALTDEVWKPQTWRDASNTTTTTGYAYRRIDALKGYPVKLEVKANGDLELWLNGKRLIERKNTKLKEAIKRSIFLQQGRNDLVVRLAKKDNKPAINFSLKMGIDSTMESLLARPDLTVEQSKKLFTWYGPFDDGWAKLNAAVMAHNKTVPKPKMTNFYQAKKNGKTYGKYDIHHLVRGNSDVKLKRANPGFLEALIRTDDKEKHWLNDAATKEPRVAFANWITDEKEGAGSLVARVIVNRIWRQHMGKGIVASTSNFGQNGARPTHPELLDWLAQTLIDNNWSQKSIHRLILNSATYRQGIATSKKGKARDPANDLLWTRRKQRIEGEIVRDRLLQLSGTLDTRMYGKGTQSLTDPRRSVYLTVKRSKLLPFLQLFDAPDAIEGKAVRNETNSAPQALTLMNSPFVREMSAKLATRVKSDSSADFINKVYWHVLSRPPSAKEQTYFADFFVRQTALYASDKDAAEKVAIDFCQLLICSNEFVYID